MTQDPTSITPQQRQHEFWRDIRCGRERGVHPTDQRDRTAIFEETRTADFSGLEGHRK